MNGLQSELLSRCNLVSFGVEKMRIRSFSVRVAVDRTRTARQVLEATNLVQVTDRLALASIPGRGNGVEEIDVTFFCLPCRISDDELELEFEIKGLAPDFYAQAAVNEKFGSAFSDLFPNSCIWKDEKGRKYFGAFYWAGERFVYACRRKKDFWEYPWEDNWWFAGVKKTRRYENGIH